MSSSDGAMFQLGLIDRESKSFMPLHKPCNLSNQFDRAKAAEYVLLVRPALVTINKRIIRDSKIPSMTCTRHHLYPVCEVTLTHRVRKQIRIIEKEWRFRDVADATELCNRLYQCLKGFRIRCLSRCYHLKRSSALRRLVL